MEGDRRMSNARLDMDTLEADREKPDRNSEGNQ